MPLKSDCPSRETVPVSEPFGVSVGEEQEAIAKIKKAESRKQKNGINFLFIINPQLVI